MMAVRQLIAPLYLEPPVVFVRTGSVYEANFGRGLVYKESWPFCYLISHVLVERTTVRDE